MEPPGEPGRADATAQQLLAEGTALRALARRLVGAGDADDLVQDGYAAAIGTKGKRKVGAWLAGTVRHLATMLRRSATRRESRERAVARHEVDVASDPAAIAMQSELLREVGAAVHALDRSAR